MDKKVIIFDFDGVIANSFEAGVAIFNDLADSFGMEKMSMDQADKLRSTPSREFIKNLKISKWRLPFLLWKARKRFYAMVDSVAPFPEMVTILKSLKKKDYYLILLTSNSEVSVKKFLSKNDIDVFDEIYSKAGLFTKHRMIKKIAMIYGPEKIWSIGDETRDIEAAKKAGVRAVAVTWGYNSAEILKKYSPEYIIDKPEELLEIFP